MSRIAYCIKPYAEELLYSQIARMFDNCLERKMSSALLTLFNSSSYQATIDLPNHLDALYTSCYYKILESSDLIIDRYTLYPFYQPFLTSSKRERVKSLMKGNTEGNKIHCMVGLNASSYKRFRVIRFCPSCLEEDKLLLGEQYWKRIHQVPGVLVCPIHNEFLVEYEPSINQLKSNLFISAERVDHVRYKSNRNKDNNLLSVAKLFEEVLLQKVSFNINSIDYKEGISFKYLVGKTIKFNRFIEDFQTFYGRNLLFQYFKDEDNKLSWIPAVIRRPTLYFSPLKHLLLFNFIQTIPRQMDLFHSYSEFKVIWKCNIATCPHSLKENPEEKKIFYDSTLKRTVFIIKCKCGMEYKAWLINTEGKPQVIKSIIDYGDFWRSSVLQYKQQGKSVSFIAKSLNTSWASVNRYLKSYKEKTNPKELLQQHKIKKCRAEYEELLNSFDQFAVSQARKSNNALYKWLYNNDLEWLRITHALYSNLRTGPTLKLDWNKIDAELVSRVAKAAKELKDQKFKGRITKKIISLLLSKENNYLSVHEKKMPLCMKKLQEEAETSDEFQIRKSKLAIEQIVNSGKKISIAKIARVGKFVRPTVATIKFIESEIAKIKVA